KSVNEVCIFEFSTIVFFASRRRHTRSKRDWSSDVCSSDLQFFRVIDRAGAIGVGSTTAGLALGLVGFAVATQCTRILSAALRARDALLGGSRGWLIVGAVSLVVVRPSPQRSAAEAARVYALASALGMALAGVMGLTRIAAVLEHGGHLAQVRRTAIVVPFAVLGGGVPGLLLGRQLVTSDAGGTSTVLVGVLCGLVAALLSAGLMGLPTQRPRDGCSPASGPGATGR